MAKQLTELEAAEILARLIQPKPEPGGQATMISADRVWMWWPLRNGRYGDWQLHEFYPFLDMNAAMQCATAAGLHWQRIYMHYDAIGFVVNVYRDPDAEPVGGTLESPMDNSGRQFTTAMALSMAVLEVVCGEPVEVTP